MSDENCHNYNADEWLRANLVCPYDFDGLKWAESFLSCPHGHEFPIIQGVPIMPPSSSEKLKIRGARYCYQDSKMGKNNESAANDFVDNYAQQIFIDGWGAGIMNRLTKQRFLKKLTGYPVPELPLKEGIGRIFLDIGCNWGRWSLSAARKGYRVVGIDPLFDAILAARRVSKQQNVSAAFIVAEAGFLPFRENAFDTVFSYNVFQYFEKEYIRNALHGIVRVLKKDGGCCMIQLPNIMGIRNLYHQICRHGGNKNYPHNEIYWKVSEMKKVFEDIVGPTQISADGYLTLNFDPSCEPYLPAWDRWVLKFSSMLLRLSIKVRWMTNFADGVFVRSDCRKSAKSRD